MALASRPPLLDRLRAVPPRAYLAAGWLALLAAASIWFFAGTDGRGRTARLAADAEYYHAYLPTLVLDRDLDFTNQYAITKNWYRFGKTELGRPGNVFGIGPALFELPAFLIGHVAARATSAHANGFSRAEVLPPLYMSLLASLGALVPAYLLLRRRLGGALAPVLAPLLVAAAGPVVYYAIRQPGYAHPFATFFVAYLVERWDASFDGGPQARSLGTWSIFGLLVGASALARPQCALWAVLFAVAAVDDARRTAALSPLSRRATARMILVMVAPRWVAGALVAVVVFAPQMLAWKALHGSLIVTPQGPGFMWWSEPAWSEVLFSSRNGLLPWAPLYALAAAGLAVAAFRTPRIGIALLAGVGLQMAANGAVWDWWAGGSFGGRRFDSAYIAFAYGLGALIAWPGIWRERAWRARAGQAAVAAAVLLSVVLAAANLALVGRESGPTVRIHGGEAASRIIDRKIRGPLGSIASSSSSLANLPARLLFAWRHDTSLTAYDRVVGVHQLGELYPGLNSIVGKTHQPIALDRAGAPHLLGFAPGPAPKAAAMIEGSAVVLVGLNRRDPVTFTARASSAVPGTIELWLDGARLAALPLAPKPIQIRGTTPRARRGVNELEIRAPAGTVLHSLDVRATRFPAGD
jgi:hypothetical protein